MLEVDSLGGISLSAVGEIPFEVCHTILMGIDLRFDEPIK